ncbi:MAG: N-acetylmuramoyl-L-alanine amidase [Bacteroidales bacterium]|nr:N-acetylmuramoyl-L-alanine amidase [Bacteroidales bacterium]
MFSNTPKYAILRSTATPPSIPIPVNTLLQEELNAGKDSIGYHYYIRRDGSLSAHRPLHQRGNHTPGYNRCSVAILYEGGLDKEMLPCDTMTMQQSARLNQLLEWLKSLYPEIEFKRVED